MFFIITGSSGYVASALIPLISHEGWAYTGIDLVGSPVTHIIGNIGLDTSKITFQKKSVIINLAAARFDFGVSAKIYYEKNVLATKYFLKSLDCSSISKFIHISSVAAFDGMRIQYSERLGCDDAYRVTKYMQEVLVIDWCRENNISCAILYPSAIFDSLSRTDTNIGKLQAITKFIPVFPDIQIKKSLTFLPNFSKFIIYLIISGKEGRFLCIEHPVLNVGEILSLLANNKCLIKILFLKNILYIFSYILRLLTFGILDPKLTPNRVKKLFTETSYDWITNIDKNTYRDFVNYDLRTLLIDVSKANK